jgi:hypothetical protein
MRSQALPRRTFLRGLGATLALPMLDAMVPAVRPSQHQLGRPRRFCLHPERRLHECRQQRVEAHRRGHELRVVTHPDTARAVS